MYICLQTFLQFDHFYVLRTFLSICFKALSVIYHRISLDFSFNYDKTSELFSHWLINTDGFLRKMSFFSNWLIGSNGFLRKMSSSSNWF